MFFILKFFKFVGLYALQKTTLFIYFLLYFMQSDDTRIAREVEAQEIRIRKELEKQDNLRRKVFLK